ncbi:MAG: exo-alpha-sialidase, partial [Planctomycetes bacterium]|nr:exo-alpha-sialidase [Planctomycetota bacterium]
LLLPLLLAGALPPAAQAQSPARAGAPAAVDVGRGREPQLAVDPDGHIWVAYGDDNAAWVVTSEDGGKSYTRPARVGGFPAMALGMRRGPRIAAGRQGAVVTAIGGAAGRGQAGELMAWSTTGRGAAWSGPTRLNAEPGSAREGLHHTAANADGRIASVWLDLRRGQMDLYAALSPDGGATWGKDALLYQSPAGHVCECCQPSVAVDPKGGVLAMFRNFLDGCRDMHVIRCSPDGKPQPPAVKLGAGSWRLDACPMDGGAIAVGTDGAAVTIWRRERTLFLAAPGGAEQELGAGEQGWVAAGPKGAHAVWLTGRGGDLMYQAPGAAPRRLAERAKSPVIASAPGGKPPIVAAWQADDYRLQVLVLSPAGR